MKNIHVLPTEKPSRLWKNNLLQGKLELSKEILIGSNTAQNIYITNSEEIKEGDWFLDDNNQISRSYRLSHVQFANPKKIILTTDVDLIKNGVQAIDDEFLEWFVKNPSCEEVDVKNPLIANISDFGYKITIPKTTQQIIDEDFSGGLTMGQIIPKEESKQIGQITEKGIIDTIGNCANCGVEFHIHKDVTEYKQETLEEAAERTEFERYGQILTNYTKQRPAYNLGFNNGAKWQAERMYSEEELKQAYLDGCDLKLSNPYHVKEWFEQFKNK